MKQNSQPAVQPDILSGNGTNAVPSMRDVEGKVAFITGGDSGIGLGISRAFVDAGMKVVITYQSRTHLDHAMNELKSGGSRVHAIHLDITDRAAVEAAAEKTVAVFGKIHVLINNAGLGLHVPLSSATFDDWDWCMNVNVNGVFNGVRAFLPRIQGQDEGGHIVATSSMLGGLVVGRYCGVHSTSKFAVTGMMEALRDELAGTKIGVSVFFPAGVTSNVGYCQRNRPATLPEEGASDARMAALIHKFEDEFREAYNVGPEPFMDPLKAGECVLHGIRNNDLYIFSHPEYKQAIRERNEALLASVPECDVAPTSARAAIAKVLCTPIYANETARKLSTTTHE